MIVLIKLSLSLLPSAVNKDVYINALSVAGTVNERMSNIYNSQYQNVQLNRIILSLNL